MEPPPTLPPQRPPPSPPPSPLAPAVEEGRQLDIEVLYVLFGIVILIGRVWVRVTCGVPLATVT